MIRSETAKLLVFVIFLVIFIRIALLSSQGILSVMLSVFSSSASKEKMLSSLLLLNPKKQTNAIVSSCITVKPKYAFEFSELGLD